MNALTKATEKKKVPVNRPHCSTIADFYTRAARRTIFRLLPTFFVKNSITVTETLHRGDMLQLLENLGMELQRAVQMAAIETTGKAPLQETIGKLTNLIIRGISKVKEDKKADVFPHPALEGFLPLAQNLHTNKEDGLYLLNGALAGFLHDTRNWNLKLSRLCAILATCRREDIATQPPQRMLHDAIDEIISEILLTPAILPELIGQGQNYGDLLMNEARLFLGMQIHGAYGEGEGLDRLAGYFAAGLLPLSHVAVASRLRIGIAAQKPLQSVSTDEELKCFYRLAQMCSKCIGPHLTRQQMKTVLEQRSSRFTKPEALRRTLERTILPDEKIAKLFFIAACILDAHGRYAIADMIFRFATADSFVRRFQTSQIPLTRRLHRLSELNHYALKSPFDRDQCLRMAKIFDNVAWGLVSEARLFDIIRSQKSSPAAKLLTIYKLYAAGSVTEGQFSKKAQEEVQGYLNQQGFLETYRKARGIEGDNNVLWTDLREKLQRIGIEPNAALQKLAS